MKAKLEEDSVEHRGVILTSETEEEAKILQALWCCKARAAMFGRLAGGVIELVIAPSAAEED